MAILDPLTKYFRYRKVLPLLYKIEKKYKRPLKILDAGGADGDFHLILKKRNHIVYILDNQSKENVDYVVDLEKKLPFKDKEFDLVVSLAVIEHLYNWEGCLEEFKRVSENIILTTPTRLGKPILEFFALLNLVNKEHIKDHKYYLTKEDFLIKGYSYKTFLFGLNSLAWIIKEI